jgi:hypothetical protein
MVINSFCQGSQKLLPQAKTLGVPLIAYPKDTSLGLTQVSQKIKIFCL